MFFFMRYIYGRVKLDASAMKRSGDAGALGRVKYIHTSKYIPILSSLTPRREPPRRDERSKAGRLNAVLCTPGVVGGEGMHRKYGGGFVQGRGGGEG